jgi:hypothetical protein
MNVITPPCPMCKERGVLEDALGFVRWSELGENIQDVQRTWRPEDHALGFVRWSATWVGRGSA